MGLSCLCHLPGRFPSGVFAWNADGWSSLGNNPGKGAAAVFFGILEEYGEIADRGAASFEKNFKNCKKYVCIWGKMGYNKME